MDKCKLNKYLEVSIEGHLTEIELEEIISELKSAKEKHGSINTLLDFTTLTGYDKILLDKNDYFLSFFTFQSTEFIQDGAKSTFFTCLTIYVYLQP